MWFLYSVKLVSPYINFRIPRKQKVIVRSKHGQQNETKDKRQFTQNTKSWVTRTTWKREYQVIRKRRQPLLHKWYPYQPRYIPRKRCGWHAAHEMNVHNWKIQFISIVFKFFLTCPFCQFLHVILSSPFYLVLCNRRDCLYYGTKRFSEFFTFLALSCSKQIKG